MLRYTFSASMPEASYDPYTIIRVLGAFFKIAVDMAMPQMKGKASIRSFSQNRYLSRLCPKHRERVRWGILFQEAFSSSSRYHSQCMTHLRHVLPYGAIPFLKRQKKVCPKCIERHQLGHFPKSPMIRICPKSPYIPISSVTPRSTAPMLSCTTTSALPSSFVFVLLMMIRDLP